MIVRKAKDFMFNKLETGHYTFSLREAENAVGAGRNTWEAVDRLVKQGWLFTPSKGFYVIIDPQHQGSGYLPVEWFIDDWMKHLGGQYYLAGLTAAMLHGASHQKPQAVQVIRDRVFSDIDKDPYRISFIYKKTIIPTTLDRRQSAAGYYLTSNAEMTAYDIIRYSRVCPSLNLAATVLQELGEAISSDGLAELADFATETATLQRLGWLLDRTGWTSVTDGLAAKLKTRHMVWRPIRTDLSKDGPRDYRWRIIANTDIEVDL